MAWRDDRERLLVWASIGIGGLLLSLLSWMGARAWSDTAENSKDISGMKADRTNDHDAIQEIRQDVKDIKNMLIEKSH